MHRRVIAFITIFTIMVVFVTPMAPVVKAETLGLEGRVVVLDPGHGLWYTNKYSGYDEQVAMLNLALKIKPLLEARGATVYLARPTSENVSLPARAAFINILALEAVKNARLQESDESHDYAADIAEIDRLLEIMQSIVDDPEVNGRIYMNYRFEPERGIHPDLAKVFQYQDDSLIRNRFLVISLHSNATARPTDSSASGATAYYISNEHHNTRNYYTEYVYSDQSRHFGDVLLDHIAVAGLRKREAKVENFFMIREHNVPGVLVENGFHTNARDRANLQNDSFLDGLAVAYLNAITAYFNELPLPDSQTTAPAVPALPYSDVHHDAWYYEAVRFVTDIGLFRGTAPSRFSPEDGMTRAMLAALLASMVDADVSGYTEAPYDDVFIDAWYGKEVAWAAENGLISYIDGRFFEPDRIATREETALMVYNYFLMIGMEFHIISATALEDDSDISDWGRTAIYALWWHGVIAGDDQNRFNPQMPITRAETAQLLTNMLNEQY